MLSVPAAKKLTHYAVRFEDRKRPVYVCARCLVVWPCLAAHNAARAAAKRERDAPPD